MFTDIKVIPTFDLDYQRNSYAYDYFKNTNRRALEEENHIRRHDQYTLLLDFLLALKVSKEIRYLVCGQAKPQQVFLKYFYWQ